MMQGPIYITFSLGIQSFFNTLLYLSTIPYLHPYDCFLILECSLCNEWRCITNGFSCQHVYVNFQTEYYLSIWSRTRDFFNIKKSKTGNTVCPTRYRTGHFFNNFTTNEDIATNTDTHYRHIPLHFSHNDHNPVQISLQYLHWC